MVWASGALGVKAHRNGDVLVARVTGFITIHSAGLARRTIAAALQGEAGVAAVLADLRGASFLLDDTQWETLAPISAREHPIAMPIAVLVQAIEFDSIGRHCMRMANHGFMRAAFVLESEALAWAAHWARYWPSAARSARKSQPAGGR